MDMTARSRELDARVAVHIMGYYWYEASNGFRLLLPPESDEEWSYTEAGGPYQYTPPFSTDIAQAWKVFDRLADMGYVFFIKADGLRDGTFSPRYTAICGNQPRTDAATGPLAICIAALKALGEIE